MKQPNKTKKALYVEDKNDPNFQMYSDSLNLYKAYDFHKQNQKSAFIEETDSHAAANRKMVAEQKADDPTYNAPDWLIPSLDGKTLRDIRQKNLGKVGSQKNTFSDGYKSTAKWDPIDTEADKRVYDYYKSLKFYDDVKVGNYASPDIHHKTIKPKLEEFDGIAYNPVYENPKRPVFVKGTKEAEIAQRQEKYGVDPTGIWTDSDEEAKKEWIKKQDPDYKYNEFKKSLPENLRSTDESTYNMRGYWDALGNPEKFDTNQAKQENGTYKTYSRNPKTGEILRKQSHPEFNKALEEDAQRGYMAYEKDGIVYTFDKSPGKGYKPFETKRDDGLKRVSWGSGEEIDRAMGWYRDPVTRKLIPTPRVK